jgi:protein-tyrosine-phosphatase
MAIEEKVDVLRRQIDADLVRLRQEDRIPLDALTPLMTISRRFERVSDQAKNICSEVLYMCTGEYAKHKGAEAFRILFVDEHNASPSQMAEAIGGALRQPRLVFNSAGLEPRPLDPRTVSFLAQRGVDISRNVPKSVEQVPNLEHYQVIIALDEKARRAFPPRPKTVCLDWTVRDLSTVQGSDAEVQAAYAAAYENLQNHIHDLAEAILGQAE